MQLTDCKSVCIIEGYIRKDGVSGIKRTFAGYFFNSLFLSFLISIYLSQSFFLSLNLQIFKSSNHQISPSPRMCKFILMNKMSCLWLGYVIPALVLSGFIIRKSFIFKKLSLSKILLLPITIGSQSTSEKGKCDLFNYELIPSPSPVVSDIFP